MRKFFSAAWTGSKRDTVILELDLDTTKAQEKMEDLERASRRIRRNMEYVFPDRPVAPASPAHFCTKPGKKLYYTGRFVDMGVKVCGGTMVSVQWNERVPRKGQYAFDTRTGRYRFSYGNKGDYIEATFHDREAPCEAAISRYSGRLVKGAGTEEMVARSRAIRDTLSPATLDWYNKLLDSRSPTALSNVPPPTDYDSRYETPDIVTGYVLRSEVEAATILAPNIKCNPLTEAELAHMEKSVSMKTHCAIVGAGFSAGAQERLNLLERGQRGSLHKRTPLHLAREPENPHDKNAVAVWHDGQRLGYIPRGDAKVVAKVMDAGVRVQANYKKGHIAELWWPAETKQGVDEAYRRAMQEHEGL